MNKLIKAIINERSYQYPRTKFAHTLRIYFTYNDIFNQTNYNGKKILDIGCNEGTYSIIFSKKGFEVDAFDICDLTIAKNLNKKYNTDVNFFNMSVENISLGKKYDYVFCSEVLEHIDNQKQALEELKKVMSDKTILILSVPNVLSIYGILKYFYAFVKSLFDIRKIDPHEKFPFLRVINLFKRSGFKIKVLGSIYFFPINRFTKLNLLLSKNLFLKYFGSFCFYYVQLKPIHQN